MNQTATPNHKAGPQSRNYWPRLTVAKKITVGFLLVSLLCLAAVIYALVALSQQTERSNLLVTVQFKALILARELPRNVLALERLEKQALILKDISMLDLQDKRQEELTRQWDALADLPLQDELGTITAYITRYSAEEKLFSRLVREKNWEEATQISDQNLSPLREKLLTSLQAFLSQREKVLQETLVQLSETSSQAYHLTLLLALGGVSLAFLVAGATIFRLQKAIKRLIGATKDISSGAYETPLELDSYDEFGLLAQEFSIMAGKLKELEELQLDANPLTHLPGNLAIERELDNRIKEDQPFSHLYFDLDNFKAFNDRYGYQNGSDIIADLGKIIQKTVQTMGNPGDMVGHIGGDDYVVLSTPDRAETLAREIISQFDAVAPSYYSEEDRAAGFITSCDRYGVRREFPILTLSVVSICSNNLKNPSVSAIGREAAKMKEHLKKLPGSNYLADRREER